MSCPQASAGAIPVYPIADHLAFSKSKSTPSSSPHAPHSQPKNNRAMNSTAAFTRANRLCSQVMKTNPIVPAISIDTHFGERIQQLLT